MSSSILERVVTATPANYTDFGYMAIHADVSDAVRTGHLTSAREHFEHFGLPEQRPILILDSGPDYLEAGDALRQNGEFASALEAYRLASEKSPAEAGQARDRMTALTAAAETRWDSFRFRQELAAARAADPLAEAVKVLAEGWIAAYPDNAQSWRELAAYYIDREEYEKAVPPLLRSLAIRAQQPLAMVMLTQSYLFSKETEKALAASAAAETLVTGIPTLQLNLGGLLVGLKRHERALDYARALRDTAGLPLAGRQGLMIEALAGAGYWDQAVGMLDGLGQSHPAIWAEVAHRVCWIFAQQMQRAIEAERPRDALEIFATLRRHLRDAPPARFWRETHHLASTSLYLEGHPDTAIGHYARSIDFGAIGLSGVAPPAPISRRMAARATVCTSLMPRRLDIQLAAVRSWRAFGCEVMSVNSAEEIRQLEPAFPGVRFVRAERDARAAYGKPLMYVDDLLSALETSDSDLLGIINSDIVLKHPFGSRISLDELSHFAGVGLTFGNRINVERLGQWDGKLFIDGYDWFFFGRETLRCFKGTDLVFGAPWWDFWLPVATLLHGHDLVNVRRLGAYHADHPLGWSEKAFYGMGQSLVDALAASCRDHKAQTLAALAIHDLAATLTHASDGKPLSRDVLGRLCQTLNAIIQGEMRTLDL